MCSPERAAQQGMSDYQHAPLTYKQHAIGKVLKQVDTEPASA